VQGFGGISWFREARSTGKVTPRAAKASRMPAWLSPDLPVAEQGAVEDELAEEGPEAGDGADREARGEGRSAEENAPDRGAGGADHPERDLGRLIGIAAL